MGYFFALRVDFFAPLIRRVSHRLHFCAPSIRRRACRRPPRTIPDYVNFHVKNSHDKRPRFEVEKPSKILYSAPFVHYAMLRSNISLSPSIIWKEANTKCPAKEWLPLKQGHQC
jgi:hypothetical protein